MYSTPEFEALNSVKYLYLRELSEPKDNSLRLVIAEAVDNRSASSLAYDATSIKWFRQIVLKCWIGSVCAPVSRKR